TSLWATEASTFRTTILPPCSTMPFCGRHGDDAPCAGCGVLPRRVFGGLRNGRAANRDFDATRAGRLHRQRRAGPYRFRERREEVFRGTRRSETFCVRSHDPVG